MPHQPLGRVHDVPRGTFGGIGVVRVFHVEQLASKEVRAGTG
jgi:hypothetical protein